VEIVNRRWRAGRHSLWPGTSLHGAAMNRIVCERCYRVDYPEFERRGNPVIGVVLLLFFIVPGVIYLIATSGERPLCRGCRSTTVLDVTRPEAKRYLDHWRNPPISSRRDP